MGAGDFVSAVPILGAAYTRPIIGLNEILVNITVAMGGVMLVVAGIKFAMAFKQLDQQGEHQAIYAVVAGGILIGIGSVVAALT